MSDPQTPIYEYLDKTGLNRYDNNIKSLINQKTIKIRAKYDTSPAIYSHAVGDYIYFNERIYKVTAAISQGDEIVVTSGSTTGNVEVDPLVSKDTRVDIDSMPGDGGGEGASLLRADYETSPATAAHAIDDILYYNTKFYDVTSAIAIGDTLTVSSGSTVGNISERLGGMSYEVFGIPGGGSGGTVIADDVSYDNTSSGLSATNVQDAIDEVNSNLTANKKGVAVNMASYTSLSNAYITPESGYVLLNCTYSASEYGQVDIYSSDDSLISRLTKSDNLNGACALSVYVHKGMKVVVFSRSANATVVFYGIQA